MKTIDAIALGWLVLMNAATLCAFGWDKWRASRGSSRVAESRLALLAALGGWPGGCLGMNLFRHKTAKRSFKLKFALTLIPFVAEVWAWWNWR